MSRCRKLTTICCAAVFALGLAACGGGGGSSTVTTMPEPAGPTAESIKADAADAVTAAMAASRAAEQARKDAAKFAGMLTAEEVNGESTTAISNAEMVLDAEMAADAAVMAADGALQDATAAKAAAEALPADDAGRAGAIAAAERAIEQATEQKEAAMAIVDEPASMAGSLKASAATVKGANRLAEGYPMMPAAIGKRIAGEVRTAIGTAVPGTNGALEATTPRVGINNDSADIGAMTWAMVVGEDNIMMERIGNGNEALPVTSIEGMDASAVNPGEDDLSSAGGTNGKYDDATSTDATDINYKGIPGTVWCLGGEDGCSVSAAGELVGGWYFTPTSTTKLYIADPDMAGMYMEATMYATYGYWLTYDENDAAIGITLHSATTAPTTTLDLGQAGTGDDAKDVTATYSGSAVGISVRGDASGQFTADVNLTAKFAVIPTLRGSISNFQGNAVGNWTAILNETVLDITNADFANGTTAGGGTPGVWTAQGYGPTPVDHDGDTETPDQNQRPTGFFGRFSATFGGGDAAVGAYTTRAD